MTVNRVLLTNIGLLCGAFVLALWSVNVNALPSRTIPNIVSNSLGLFYVLGPALGLIGAKEMARFKGLVRSRTSGILIGRIAFRSLGYAAVFGILAPSIYLVAQLLTTGSFNLSTDLIMGALTICLQSMTWIAFGAALGLYLPAVVAAALGLFVPFILAAYPVTMGNVAWRQMFGQPYTSCCSVSQQIDPILWKSSILVLGSILAGAFILVLTFNRRQKPVLLTKFFSIVVLGLVACAGYGVAKQGNYDLAVPRPEDAMRCEGDICLWPETPAEQRVANERVWNSLGVRGYRLVDTELVSDRHLLFARTSDEREVRKHILTQLLVHEPELKNSRSCWSSEDGELSLADALPDLELEDLESAVLTSSGKWRGLHGTNQGIDVRMIARHVNRECQGQW